MPDRLRPPVYSFFVQVPVFSPNASDPKLAVVNRFSLEGDFSVVFSGVVANTPVPYAKGIFGTLLFPVSDKSIMITSRKQGLF